MSRIWLNMSVILVLLLLRNHVFSFLIFFKLFFQRYLQTKLAIFSHFWDYICTTVFLKLKFLFSIVSSILSRIMCKLSCQLRNAKIYPIEVKILKIIFFSMSFYGQFRQFFHISKPILSRHFFLFFSFNENQLTTTN